MANTERILGALGTVEGAYRPKDSPKYSCASKPTKLGPIAIACTVPTKAQRMKRAKVEQQTKRITPKTSHKANALWAQYEGYRDYDDTYGITVKCRGVSPSTYWRSWSHSEILWHEITGLNLEEIA